MLKIKRVLIVEDSPNIVMLEKISLQASGYQVLVAVDGLEGLKMAAGEYPDLILLDLLLPKLNGYLFLKALHDNPALAYIPVLITSAKAQANDLARVKCFNIRGYLIKPFTAAEMLTKIAEIQDEEASHHE
jgi:two-component system alkaline phosphatase synthesis response regulator PhoP